MSKSEQIQMEDRSHWVVPTYLFVDNTRVANECNVLAQQVQKRIASIRDSNVKLLAQYALESLVLEPRSPRGFREARERPLPLNLEKKLTIHPKSFEQGPDAVNNVVNHTQDLYFIMFRLQQFLTCIDKLEMELPDYAI